MAQEGVCLERNQESSGYTNSLFPARAFANNPRHPHVYKESLGQPTNVARRPNAMGTFLLGFFGFLRSHEFTIPDNSAYDPQRHITPQDIAIDSLQDPFVMGMVLKQSKTGPV